VTKILITGASGHVGTALVRQLIASQHDVIATDIRKSDRFPEGAQFEKLDVTGNDASRLITEHKPDTVVHLASIVTPPKGASRKFLYDVDVQGTQNVLSSCIEAGVKRLVVTSSGAAYGYHPENKTALVETDPIRGNVEFAYAHHKRLAEELLAETRESHPSLEQVILRVGTVLGDGVENQITSLFHKPRLLALWGCDSAFVFIWTKDLANILTRAATNGPVGIFNVAGDGALTIREIASVMEKPVLSLPASLLKAALALAKPLGLSIYGPEQVRFLQYRPVLNNQALKESFGYIPEKTSREIFLHWWDWAKP
jgi:UDP-glucose 4-epimerase